MLNKIILAILFAALSLTTTSAQWTVIQNPILGSGNRTNNFIISNIPGPIYLLNGTGGKLYAR